MERGGNAGGEGSQEKGVILYAVTLATRMLAISGPSVCHWRPPAGPSTDTRHRAPRPAPGAPPPAAPPTPPTAVTAWTSQHPLRRGQKAAEGQRAGQLPDPRAEGSDPGLTVLVGRRGRASGREALLIPASRGGRHAPAGSAQGRWGALIGVLAFAPPAAVPGALRSWLAPPRVASNTHSP